MKLEVDSVNLRFGDHVVLSDVYMGFETGEVGSLLGRNGTGKSCLFNIIIGSLKSQYASVRVDKCYYPSLFKSNLLKYLPQTFLFPSNMRLSNAAEYFELDIENISEKFDKFHIPISSKFYDLSGGQRRMAEILIILNCSCPFVILDEPFTHLSPIQIDALKIEIKEYTSTKGIIISDHQYQHVIDISDKIYLLNAGKTHLLKPENVLEQLQNFMYII